MALLNHLKSEAQGHDDILPESCPGLKQGDGAQKWALLVGALIILIGVVYFYVLPKKQETLRQQKASIVNIDSVKKNSPANSLLTALEIILGENLAEGAEQKDTAHEKKSPLINKIAGAKTASKSEKIIKGKETKKSGKAPSHIANISLTTGVRDYVYNSSGKRDPFASIINRRSKSNKVDEFIKNAKSLKPVNFYLYNKVEKKDPALYKKLKKYARLFRNKRSLSRLSEEKRTKKLKDYKELLNKVRNNFHDPVLWPLQTRRYSSLKLVGIIWGKMGHIAMVETPDRKAYNVKEKDMVGPNYGVVEKISASKIIVVEKYINYIGKISSIKKIIELPKSGESA